MGPNRCAFLPISSSLSALPLCRVSTYSAVLSLLRKCTAGIQGAFSKCLKTRLTVFRRFAQVTLMKYLYKAMESLGSDPNTQASGNVVLGWHEKVRFSSLFSFSFLRPPCLLPPSPSPLPALRSNAVVLSTWEVSDRRAVAKSEADVSESRVRRLTLLSPSTAHRNGRHWVHRQGAQ
jgi:hypothetical protein